LVGVYKEAMGKKMKKKDKEKLKKKCCGKHMKKKGKHCSKCPCFK